MSEICFIEPSSGIGPLKVKIWPVFSEMLVARSPERFSLVQSEICGDGKDNDCDRVIDEDCAVAPAPPRWSIDTPQCDHCMQDKCSTQVDGCVGTHGCMDAIQCVAENRCLGSSLGPLSCICGEGVSIAECSLTRAENLKGECATELAPDQWGITGPVPLFVVSPSTAKEWANFALACMTRFCSSECSGNTRSDSLAAVCGNGRIEKNEVCDDGNTSNGDGCSSSCEKEAPKKIVWDANENCDICMEQSCGGRAPLACAMRAA